jgi:hypothetical protein
MSEISGIIRNGIERGWPKEEIRNSLINSGYSVQEIDYEFSKILNVQQVVSPQSEQTLAAPEIPAAQQNKFNSQDLTNYQMPIQPEKKAGNWIVIAIIFLLVLCVLAGAGLYLFG